MSDPDALLEGALAEGEHEVVDGIAVLARPLDEQKRRQAAFTDHEVDAEYEITRPHGTPLVYGRLLASKFERGLRGLEGIAAGGSALVVCGGSGMDAEFLARAGATVVSTDLSLQGAIRARERAERYGLPIAPAVADAERLPFGDRAFDLVWVHDGLHHLERPDAALAEMARVAGGAVSVNEPADAALTALAVRVGLAEAEEEAGNRVERMQPEEVAEGLRLLGFSPVAVERYAMLYRHQAGPLYRLLSRRALAPGATTMLDALGAILGSVGNKLSVRAVRER